VGGRGGEAPRTAESERVRERARATGAGIVGPRERARWGVAGAKPPELILVFVRFLDVDEFRFADGRT
jgi:hypothetical protein